MKSLCFCRRAPAGFAFYRFDLPADMRPEPIKCCSLEHLQFIAARKGNRVPTDKLEKLESEAIEAASEAAGAYLEQIGKTDLATMSGDEWLGFLAHTFKVTTSELDRLVNEHETPF